MSVSERFIRRTLVILAVLMLLTATAVFAVYESERRAIVSVRVAGELRHTSRVALETVVSAHAVSSLYRVDVASVRDAALTQAWVKDASVRRVWPDSLHIAVVEREPVARWRQSGLLEADASVFYPPSLEVFAELPMLEGPDGTESEVLHRYEEISRLVSSVSRRVAHLSLDERHAWQIELDNGILLVLGQNQNDAALRRFVSVFYAVLQADHSQLERVDLRYTNGFAVLWKTRPLAQIEGEQG
jgi:cell division protein FtsQ